VKILKEIFVEGGAGWLENVEVNDDFDTESEDMTCWFHSEPTGAPYSGEYVASWRLFDNEDEAIADAPEGADILSVEVTA
jgi:hypothetical protein